MTMTEWFLAELESEAAKSRRVLEQVPTGKRDWKPHDRSMEFGYLCELVANIPSWVGMAITMIRDTFLHSAHHRGQMTVYLRLLGSRVPSVYGPTADDRSFG
jgi:hypothetical protein